MPSRPRAREPRVAATEAGSSTTATFRRRSGLLDAPLEDLARLAFSTARRPAADGCSLASARISVLLALDRRRILHFNVTEHPTAAWTARQLLEACGPDEAPGYLIRDRDGIYGEDFHRQARALEIDEVPTAPQSSWQNPYAERAIGSIRRECPGSDGHPQRGASPSDPFRLCALLQPGTHSSLLV